jgi:hypothetical protein
MNMKPVLISAVLCVLAAGATTASAAEPASTGKDAIKRGEYLVKIMGCNDCHTPWAMGPRGPEPDMKRMLSGHPQDATVTPPTLAEPWVWAATGTNTAFAGPWGVSFTANLTPDPDTGLGKWTVDTFMSAIRNGRHEGQGRPILPPMPWPMYRNATDEDLRAVFAYLQTIPAISNRVPMPLDPPAGN